MISPSVKYSLISVLFAAMLFSCSSTAEEAEVNQAASEESAQADQFVALALLDTSLHLTQADFQSLADHGMPIYQQLEGGADTVYTLFLFRNETGSSAHLAELMKAKASVEAYTISDLELRTAFEREDASSTTCLTINHLVKDYATWRSMFDAHDPLRRGFKVKTQAIYSAVDDPNDVTIFFSLPDVQAAITYGSLPNLNQTFQKSGVISKAKMDYFTNVQFPE